MSSIFEHLRNGNISGALKHSDGISIKSYIPLLCRILKVTQGENRVKIIRILQRSNLSSDITQLLEKNFSQIISDAQKEQRLRQKPFSRREDSALITTTSTDDIFAGSDNDAKVRIIASELIYLLSKYTSGSITSDLLACIEYQEYVSAVICILCYKIPSLFDVKEIAIMLLHLPEAKCYIDSLVFNNPVRYEEILHVFIDLFCKSKGNFELRVLSHIEDLAQVTADSRQLVCLDKIRNTRKQLMLQHTLYSTQFGANIDAILSALFSAPDMSQTIEFVKNESKMFEKLLRFSDIRYKLVVQVRTLKEQLSPKPMEIDVAADRPDTTTNRLDDSDFYCSFLDETIQKELKETSSSGTNKTDTGLEELTRPQVIRANQLLILYLNLINTCKLTLLQNECTELVRLMSHKPCLGEEGELFIRLSLALFMSCHSLNGNSEINGMLQRWLTEILNYSYDSEGKGELLLLTGMHLHSGSYEMIGPLLSQSTGLSINVSTGHAATIQTFWSQIQTEQQIVAQLANVPVTPDLSDLVSGYLPIHCMSQLITSRSPSCPTNLFSWLPRQLIQTTEPIHPVLCDLISGSVAFLMSNRSRSAGIYGIAESDLISLLAPSSPITCRILSFYYLLLYRNALAELKVKTDTQRGPAPLPPEYSVSLLGDDSAKTLLLHARDNRENYLYIYPTFLKLHVSQFPFLCDPQLLLAEEEAKENISKLHKNDKSFSINEYLNNLLVAMESGQEAKCYYMISKMLTRHHSTLSSEIIAQCIPHVVKLSFRIQCVFSKLWEMSAALNPQQTWLHSAKILVNPKITERELWVNPLLLFQAPKTIVSSSVGVKILLHMLKGYMLLCNARMSDIDPPHKKKSKEHEDNKTLYLMLQNSGVVQVLLELCNEQEGKCSKDAIDAHDHYENNALIYNFLHDFFIKHDGLSKLVCWQTFSFDLLEGLVTGVPSLHVACKFTTPLLQQNCLQKQLFSVCLLSHLAVQYPTQQTLAASTDMLQWAMSQSGELSAVWTLLSLSSFLRITTAFPPLVDAVTRLLVLQKKIVTKLNIDSVKRKMKLYSDTDVDMLNPGHVIDETFEKLMSNTLVRMRGT